MPSGTYINEVFAPRIHKSNAWETIEEAKSTIEFCRTRIQMLAARTPTSEEFEQLGSEVTELLDEYIDASHRLFLASYITDNPELCIDELENLNDLSE